MQQHGSRRAEAQSAKGGVGRNHAVELINGRPCKNCPESFTARINSGHADGRSNPVAAAVRTRMVPTAAAIIGHPPRSSVNTPAVTARCGLNDHESERNAGAAGLRGIVTAAASSAQSAIRLALMKPFWPADRLIVRQEKSAAAARRRAAVAQARQYKKQQRQRGTEKQRVGQRFRQLPATVRSAGRRAVDRSWKKHGHRQTSAAWIARKRAGS